jgi:hypothetical protein
MSSSLARLNAGQRDERFRPDRSAREPGRAIRAEWSLWVALIVSDQRRALRTPRFDMVFPGLAKGVAADDPSD